ncbi:hypothetical protein HYN69_06220 [Gemmobacter aquarius]|uniref:Uncharacterized protein n=1 Tax=Paragemmobacter aquarius TaxID=2169400 RepID=A0A2S0UK25_9RHOB|nr:hypothetical protein HYN69_06220 [Gemmobacter aquarius]
MAEFDANSAPKSDADFGVLPNGLGEAQTASFPAHNAWRGTVQKAVVVKPQSNAFSDALGGKFGRYAYAVTGGR